LLTLISVLSEILPIIFYFCFLKRNAGEKLWVIPIYCLVSFISEIAVSVFQQKVDVFYLIASFTICEYTLFTLILYLFLKEKKFRYVPLIGSVFFYTLAIINFLTKKSETFDSLSASSEAILIIIYCILFLYEQIKDQNIIYIYYTKSFWIIIAIFLYLSSTLFLFIYAATLTKQEHKSYWPINDVFNILKNILFCISIAMKKGSKISYPIENLNPDM
jgi:hypothetical protein